MAQIGCAPIVPQDRVFILHEPKFSKENYRRKLGLTIPLSYFEARPRCLLFREVVVAVVTPPLGHHPNLKHKELNVASNTLAVHTMSIPFHTSV